MQWAKWVKDRRALDMRSVLRSLKSRAEELCTMADCELANPQLFHEVCKFPLFNVFTLKNMIICFRMITIFVI